MFEEVVKQILFERYDTPEIVFKVNYKKDLVDINVKYNGEKFDISDTKNDISLKLVEGLASSIDYSFSEVEEYKNVLEIKIE